MVDNIHNHIHSWYDGGQGSMFKVESGMPVKEYKWEDIGIKHSQYFSGRGPIGTPYTHVYVGVCDDWLSAAEDCLEQAAGDGWGVDHINPPCWGDDEHIRATSVRRFLSVEGDIDVDAEDDMDVDSLYYFVALYLRGE